MIGVPGPARVGGDGRPIFVSGMAVSVPGHGGATWAVLQYVHGLRSLGYDAVLVEPVPGRPSAAVIRYFDQVVASEGLAGRAALLVGEDAALGMDRDEILALAARAPALLNLAGTLADPDILGRIPVRVYVDLDPAFTQLWSAQGIDMRLGGHTHFASVGPDIGSPSCAIPAAGLDWIPTLPPVALGRWPVAAGRPGHAWTTVANWRGYGSIEHDGRRYGQKAHGFRELMGLPTRTSERFEVALSIHPDETRDLEALAGNGWHLLDPARVASTPDRYRRFVTDSLGEIGVAKTGYAEADCGWFSDRSAVYLASGRPVVARDTGFGRHLPVGDGLLAFRTEDEAAAAVERVRADYARHARAAREVAETHLDARLVLGRLLSRAGAA